jgi:Fur family ferric uptake transcriptional regulator
MAVKRNTWQKDAVMHALSEVQGFVSAQQLFQILKQHGSPIGLATVYRTLTALVADGKADSLLSNEGENIYRDCSREHHHHLICNNCGVTVEIEAKEAETWAAKVASESGFSDVTHTIDIFGLCKKCTNKKGNQ